MDKICNYIKVVIIPHEIAEILKNLVKVIFPTTSPVTIDTISIKLYFKEMKLILDITLCL